jgi:mono/diheme cytochrome c family protein
MSPRPLWLALALTACGGPGFDKAMTLGGVVVEPAALNRGRDLYNRYCATCHGFDGKADTSQARQLDPRPRDLSLADFKRVDTPGALPSDAELSTIIVNGVPGTGMPGWPQLDPDDLQAVVHYLKTFSQRWKTEAPPGVKKSDDGAWNVLPAADDAASFRAASRAIPVEGSGHPEAHRDPRLFHRGGTHASALPSTQPPQTSMASSSDSRDTLQTR